MKAGHKFVGPFGVHFFIVALAKRVDIVGSVQQLAVLATKRTILGGSVDICRVIEDDQAHVAVIFHQSHYTKKMLFGQYFVMVYTVCH